MKPTKKMYFSLLIVSSMSMAGQMGINCQANSVQLPCATNGWHFEVDALYLKPQYGTGFYLTSFTNSNNETIYHDHLPNWSWGFNAGMGYHFGEGQDLSMNWSHHEKNHNWDRRIGTASANAVYNVAFNNKWDQVNAEFGQMADFGPRTAIRYHGGLQYAQASKQFSLSLINALSANQIETEFDGLGPRAGVDLHFGLMKGLSLVTSGAIGMLVGEQDFKTRTSGILDVRGASSGSKTAVFPEADGKIGLEYTYTTTQGDYRIQAGYQVVNYFNAFTLSTVTGQLTRHTDLGLQGAYLGVRYFGYT